VNLQLSPCEACGAEWASGKGWAHSQECENYEEPREVSFDDFMEVFGDLDPAQFI